MNFKILCRNNKKKMVFFQAMTIYTQLQNNNVAGDVIKTEAIGEVSSPKTDVEGSTISQTKD